MEKFSKVVEFWKIGVGLVEVKCRFSGGMTLKKLSENKCVKPYLVYVETSLVDFELFFLQKSAKFRGFST